MTETKTTNENAQVSIDIENQAKIITDRSDVQYLSPELITGGNLRNIVTVELITQTGNFCVDVLKHNKLQQIYQTEHEKELAEYNKQVPSDSDEWDPHHWQKLHMLITYETLVEDIVKPKLTLKDEQLYSGEAPVPTDIIYLLIQAHNVVNDRRTTVEAVQHFQESDGS